MTATRRRSPASRPPADEGPPTAPTFVILLLLYSQVASVEVGALWEGIATWRAWSFQIQDAGSGALAVVPTENEVSVAGLPSLEAQGTREAAPQREPPQDTGGGRRNVPVVLTLLLSVLYGYSLLSAVLRRRLGLLLIGLALPHLVLGTGLLTALHQIHLGTGVSLQANVALGEAATRVIVYAFDLGQISRALRAAGVPGLVCVILPPLALLMNILWITVRLRFFSRAVVWLLIVLALLAPVLHAGATHSPYWVWVLNLLSVGGLILALRLVWLVVAQNLPLFRRLGLAGTLVSGARSLVLLTPMAVLLAPFVILNEAVKRGVEDGLAASLTDTRAALGLEAGWADQADTTIPNDTRKLVAMQALLQIREIQAQAAQARRLLARDLGRDAEAIMRASMQPRIHFSRPGNSGFFAGLKNAAESIAQDTSNRAYATMRSQMISAVGKMVREGQKAADITPAINKAEADAVARVREANALSQQGLVYTFFYLEIAHRAGVVLFLLVVIKSLSYMFSRVALHHDRRGVWMSIGAEGERSKGPPRVREVGEVYELTATVPARVYMHRRFAATGCAPRFAIPQPGGSPFGRIISGTYALNRVDLQPGQPPVRYTATRGARFVEWTLREGETAMIDLRSLVGVESSVRLATLLSARFATLLLGGFAFPTVTGPGRVIFLADGRVELLAGRGEQSSLPPERILAMQTSTRLSLDSHNSFADAYLSQAYVKPQGGGAVLVNVDQQRGTRPGLLQFAVRFLWPF